MMMIDEHGLLSFVIAKMAISSIGHIGHLYPYMSLWLAAR